LIAPTAQASEELAKKYSCLACHQVDKKLVGPAYQDVAAKYKGQADAAAKLSAEVAAGAGTEAKGHPKTKASPDEIKTIVAWVLTQ